MKARGFVQCGLYHVFMRIVHVLLTKEREILCKMSKLAKILLQYIIPNNVLTLAFLKTEQDPVG